MITFDEFGDLADRLTEELPEEFFEGLSGGVILDQGAKRHEKSRPNDPLFILGEYRREGIGCCIVLYYGSFRQVFWSLSGSELEQKLRGIIRHEFRHHMEYRACVADLEREDEDRLMGYCFEQDV